MSIIQRIPWTVQPQGPVGVDLGNPLARALVALHAPGQEIGAVLTGPLTTVVTGKGRGYKGSMRFTVGSTYNLSNPHTVFTLFVPGNPVTALQVHASHSTSGQGFWLGNYYSAQAYISASGSLDVGTHVLDVPNTMAAVFEGAQVKGFFNGVQTASAATGSTSGLGKLTLMNLGAGGYPTFGTLVLAAAFERALTAAEIKSLHNNPWQLFAPRTRRIWAPSAGGGTSIAGALGTASASGFTGTVNANRTIAGALGAATASGFKGVVNANRTIAGALGVAAASGFAGTVGANRGIAGALGTAVASGFQGTVSNTSDTVIGGTLGTAVASGFSGGVAWSRFIAGVLGTAQASGFTGGVQSGDTQDASGGWPMPIRRKKRKPDDEELTPEVVEAVAEAPKERRTITLQQLIGKRAAAQVDAAELSQAIRTLRLKKRQREDDELMMM